MRRSYQPQVGGLADSQTNFIDSYTESLSTKAGKQLARVLYDLFADSEQEAITKILSDEVNSGKKIKDVDWLQAGSTMTSLKELDRLLNAHKHVVRSGATHG